jgi:hypothetical protein
MPFIEGPDAKKDHENTEVQGAPVKGPAFLEKKCCGEETTATKEVSEVKDLIDREVISESGPHGRTSGQKPENAEPEQEGGGPKWLPLGDGGNFHKRHDG